MFIGMTFVKFVFIKIKCISGDKEKSIFLELQPNRQSRGRTVWVIQKTETLQRKHGKKTTILGGLPTLYSSRFLKKKFFEITEKNCGLLYIFVNF